MKVNAQNLEFALAVALLVLFCAMAITVILK